MGHPGESSSPLSMIDAYICSPELVEVSFHDCNDEVGERSWSCFYEILKGHRENSNLYLQSNVAANDDQNDASFLATNDR